MNRIAILISLAALAGATSAAAESFTSTYKNDPVRVIMAPGPTPASSMVGVHWTGTTTATTKAGVATTSRYECIGWATPSQATSDAGVCEGVEGSAGKYAMQIVCAIADPAKPAGAATCWGALIGTEGRYAGTGSFTQIGDNVSGTGECAWKD